MLTKAVATLELPMHTYICSSVALVHVSHIYVFTPCKWVINIIDIYYILVGCF